MTTSNNTTAKNTMSDNTKANIIALGFMAIVIIVGVFYGMELDKIGY